MSEQSAIRTVLGQPSWRFETRDVQAHVTVLGGHLGPVGFNLPGGRVEPYQVAPWAAESETEDVPPVLEVLRGDFFCMPFGDNEEPYEGETHPPHGETANRELSFRSLDRSGPRTTLHLALRTRIREARVDKRISLVDGHHALYCQHVISETAGPMSLGHHATLRFPDRPGSGRVSMSPFVYGQVLPEPVELPENRGYSLLEPGAALDTLRSVPTITGDTTDLSIYPARRGYEDLVMLVSDPEAAVAWTAVTFPDERYAWFALKDPRVLASTVMWFSNGGRHFPPWNGRHVNVMGLEEVTSYFDKGLRASAEQNPLTRKGFRTALELHRGASTTVNYIMAVATIPEGFDRVHEIEVGADSVRLVADGGLSVETPIDVPFLQSSACRTG